MLESLQSTTPLVPGGPAWLTLPAALIAGGAVVALLILWLGARSAGKKRRAAREMEEEALAARYDAEVPATRPITPRPAPEPAPEPVAAVEPVAAEPEPVVTPEPEPVAEAPAPFCEAPAVAEPVEGAPAREAEPEPLAEAPNPAAEPIDAAPAGLGAAENEPPVAAASEAVVGDSISVEALERIVPGIGPELYAQPTDSPLIIPTPGEAPPTLPPAPIADESIEDESPADVPIVEALDQEVEQREASAAAEMAEFEAAEPVAGAALPDFAAAEPVAEPSHVAAEEAPELAAVVPHAPDPVDEPVAPAPVVETTPEPVAEAPPAPAPVSSGPDDLTRMKGVGPRLAERLNTVGVRSFADIAALTPEAAAELDSKLGDFQGRLDRDRWIDQAGYLARDDIAGFEETFGKL